MNPFVLTEQHLMLVVAAGAGLTAVGVLWLLVTAFRTHFLWGLGVLLVFPVLGVLYVLSYPARGGRPLALTLLGLQVAAVPYAINYYHQLYPDLSERDRIVDGERHLTLTGWDRTDYSVIAQKPDTVLLHMANPDVTDATLEHLKGLTHLRELDLNDTQVTDAGLAVLKGLPLTALHLKGTKVTDEGFRTHLMGLESLMDLDVRGTEVKSSTVREWKAAKPDRKALR
jgi:hypothetical protein